MLGFFISANTSNMPTAPIPIVNELLFKFLEIDRYFKLVMCDEFKIR